MNYLLILPVLFPVITGGAIALFRFNRRVVREIYVLTVTIMTSLLCLLALIFVEPGVTFTLFFITEDLPIVLTLDGMGRIFVGLVAFLWPLAVSYALEYMRHEGMENTFYLFYLLTYGVTLGIAMSRNLISLYFFYEFLTLVTLPIVMHGMKEKSIKAGRKYVAYSIGGAAFAFLSIMAAFFYAGRTDFVYGGIFDLTGMSDLNLNILRFLFVLAFFGFGVKAAVFPFHGWLPTASVAPTPVTALLHAVAVVNCGAFAIMRVTYFIFGTELLKGSWAQILCCMAACVTILFGSTFALKEQHFKRRLAYSTISNLSYMLFGAMLLSEDGLYGALSHFVFHGIIKITLFFVAGIILVKYERAYVTEIYGFGRKMKVTFACFTIASLALMGVPPTIGFTSKWNLLTGAVNNGSVLGIIGTVVILISAVLTAIYLLSIVIRAYFPGPSFEPESLSEIEDPGLYMTIPLIVLTVTIVLLGVFSGPLLSFIRLAAGGTV